jgi:hypothetical protein
MTQLNTPYPSTAYLTGFLRSRGVDAVQADLALALVLKLFTPAGLEAVRGQALALPKRDRTGSVHAFLDQFDTYRATIGPVIRFLQGRDSTLAHRIAARGLLPEGPRFAALDAYEDDGSGDPLAWAFGALGVQDKARHLCTLFLNDLADVLRDAVDERFEFVRYAESLASSQPTFDPLAQALAAPPTLVDRLLQDPRWPHWNSTGRRWCCCRYRSRARCTPRCALRRPSRRTTPWCTSHWVVASSTPNCAN